MKHTDQWGFVHYDPKPETAKARAKLEQILKHTKFNSRTKALWAYYRGNAVAEKARKSGDKVRELIILNLSLNGALDYRLMANRCRYCGTQDCVEKTLTHQQRLNRVKRSIRRTTIAHWNHAVTLIDIAKGQ